MKTLRLITFASLLVLATSVQAQEGHQHHGGAAAEATTPEVAEIAPGGHGKGGCEKCKKMGMGDKMSHGDGMGGCKHMKGSGAADTAALERRIDELEKRLDLMQLLLQREAR
ncbi:MAG: hypothetical protein MUE59_04025 [Thiobacillaceae bacterium]|jgi:hypothetical protein|nr:hypothetical protein [Thiobacillaceae bacterium]